MPDPSYPFTVLYIYGSGRCGSTLLDMMLNRHSKIIGLGEISTLMTYFNPFNLPKGYRFANEVHRYGYECFWHRVRECYEACLGGSFEQIDLRHPRWSVLVKSWGRAEAERWARELGAILTCVHNITGKPILSVANKLPHILYILLMSGIFKVRVVHLIRDGRAVVNSYVRRYNSYGGGLRMWMVTALLAPWFRMWVGRDNWLRVRYEDLASATEATLRNICDFLNVEFEPDMLNRSGGPYFGIGGSPHTFSDPKDEVRLDERWRSELPLRHRLVFTLVAGWLNRLYGYR